MEKTLKEIIRVIENVESVSLVRQDSKHGYNGKSKCSISIF